MSYKFIDLKDVDHHNRQHGWTCNSELSWDGQRFTCHTHDLSTTAERFNNFDYFVMSKDFGRTFTGGNVIAGFPTWAAAWDYINDSRDRDGDRDEFAFDKYEIVGRDGEQVR
jgi:hypothetical protein